MLRASMENPVPSTQTPLQSQSTPPQLPLQTSSKQRYVLTVLIGVIALSIVVGSGGYYLGRKNQNSIPVLVLSQAPTSIQISLTPTKPAYKSAPAMLPDWKYETDSECGVTMPIPPDKPPYITSATPSIGESALDADLHWTFTHSRSSLEFLSMVTDTPEYNSLNSVMFATKSNTYSGYQLGVMVSCVPNKNNYDNAQLIAALKEKLNEYNKRKDTEGSKYSITSIMNVNRWGQNVIDVQIDLSDDTGKSSKNYTMFSTPTHIYQIHISGQSKKPFIKETAQKIFDNLSFQTGSTEKPANTSNIRSAPLVSTDGWKTVTMGDLTFKIPPLATLESHKTVGNEKCEPPLFCFEVKNHDANLIGGKVSFFVKPYKGRSRRVEAQEDPDRSGMLPGVYEYADEKYGTISALNAQFKCQINECMSFRNVLFVVKDNLVVITDGIYKVGEETNVDGQKTINAKKESSITDTIISTFK